MRADRLLVVFAAALGLSGCAGSLRSQPVTGDKPRKFSLGFWYWQDYADTIVPASLQPDVVFFHAGSIQKVPGRNALASWQVYGDIPELLPAAREYWLTFRYERQGVPDVDAAHVVARRISQLLTLARQRHLNVRGVQFDIDSPTMALRQYAAFLRETRKGLPQGTEISITALLDWFREGTAITDVVKEADEFVPQFYDMENPVANGRDVIAATFDAARWTPNFNSFGKRYRVGLSTFGRARMDAGRSMQPVYLVDLRPLDVGGNPAFRMNAALNKNAELVLTYTAQRSTNLGYNNFKTGDRLEFVVSTPREVKAGVESVRGMHGYCAGVVFFRWPAPDETLTMQPDDVMRAAGVAGTKAAEAPGIELVDRQCAAVKCADVFLVHAAARAPGALNYRAQSSGPLEYFLPEKRTPARMVDPTHLEISVPPYGGEGRMLLGRVVSAAPVTFTVEVQ